MPAVAHRNVIAVMSRRDEASAIGRHAPVADTVAGSVSGGSFGEASGFRAITGTVSGRVQGVGFRMSTLWQAERVGVVGWVRNLADGRVEVFVQGGRTAVDEMEQWLHHGPRAARVDRASLVDVPPDPKVTSFTIR